MDKPKPLTKAEWEDGQCDGGWDIRLDATLDALFRYRERTRRMWKMGKLHKVEKADDIAEELGIE